VGEQLFRSRPAFTSSHSLCDIPAAERQSVREIRRKRTSRLLPAIGGDPANWPGCHLLRRRSASDQIDQRWRGNRFRPRLAPGGPSGNRTALFTHTRGTRTSRAASILLSSISAWRWSPRMWSAGPRANAASSAVALGVASTHACGYLATRCGSPAGITRRGRPGGSSRALARPLGASARDARSVLRSR